MKYCVKCGSELFDEAVVCPKCGCPCAQIPGLAATTDISASNDDPNGFAVAGFVCSFFSPILGIIFSAIGYSRAEKSNGKGKGLAVAGMIVSIVLFVLCLVVLAYVASVGELYIELF